MSTKKHETKSLTVSMIPFSQLAILPGLNPRFELPNLDELTDSIRNNGIQEPLKVYYSSDDEKYIVVKGHRRHAAMKNIIQEDGLDPTSVNLPCFKYGGIPEPEMILRDHIISNSGEPFTVLEKAEIIRRYIDLGFSLKETAAKIGYTYQQTYNLQILSESPDEIKEMIQAGIVSSTLVFEEFKKQKSFDLILDRMKEILLSGAAKITSKNYKVVDEEDETEMEEAQNRASTKSSTPKPTQITLEQKIMVLVDELQLSYDDNHPERNKKIDDFTSIIRLLQEGDEISTIKKLFFD